MTYLHPIKWNNIVIIDMMIMHYFRSMYPTYMHIYFLNSMYDFSERETPHNRYMYTYSDDKFYYTYLLDLDHDIYVILSIYIYYIVS
jgi:uridine phosphorylase